MLQGCEGGFDRASPPGRFERRQPHANHVSSSQVPPPYPRALSRPRNPKRVGHSDFRAACRIPASAARVSQMTHFYRRRQASPTHCEHATRVFGGHQSDGPGELAARDQAEGLLNAAATRNDLLRAGSLDGSLTPIMSFRPTSHPVPPPPLESNARRPPHRRSRFRRRPASGKRPALLPALRTREIVALVPDGQLVACYEFGADVAQRGILVLPVAGGAPRRLAGAFFFAADPVWSPDGKKILFWGLPKREEPADWWIVPLDGGVAMKIGAAAVLPELPSADSSYGFEQSRLPKPADWLADYVLFSSGNLWRLPLSPRDHKVGKPEQLSARRCRGSVAPRHRRSPRLADCLCHHPGTSRPVAPAPRSGRCPSLRRARQASGQCHRPDHAFAFLLRLSSRVRVTRAPMALPFDPATWPPGPKPRWSALRPICAPGSLPMEAPSPTTPRCSSPTRPSSIWSPLPGGDSR